jgi:hypothetical protein
MLSLESLSPQKALEEIDMANQLTVHKSLAIRQLHAQGMCVRQVGEALGVSRGAVSGHPVSQRPAGDNGLVVFSVAECVKHFDWGGNAVFSLGFFNSNSKFACESGKINKPEPERWRRCRPAAPAG